MSTLTERLGLDTTAEWMSNPARNCAPPIGATPQQIQHHADRWFASESWGESPQSRRAEKTARRLCAGCPLATTCATWAIPQADLRGVWGGLTERSRAKIRNTQNASCGTYGGYLRHRKADEEACDECRAANAEQSRRKRARRSTNAA